MSRQYPPGNWRHRSEEDDERGRGLWREPVSERGQGRGRAAEPGGSEDCFVVLHTKRYEGEATPLHPPTVLGSFSVDSEKNIRYDNSMMPVLSREYTPDGEFMQVDMDLNRGKDRVNYYTVTGEEGFKNLLRWILKNQEKISVRDSSDSYRLAADFVCPGATLKRIMQAPYAHAMHKNAEWVLLANYFRGTIYVRGQDKEQIRKEGIWPPEIYGHKFEQYMTGGNPDDVLECNCQFRCVLQLKLNGMSLLLAPDTDAVDLTRHKEDFKDMKSFVKLKACLESTKPYAQQKYRMWTLNSWWIENKLTGVPRLLVGTRNPKGVVHTIEMLKTDDLPSLAQGEWEPSVCINILEKFLHFVKRRVVAEPDVVHRFESDLALRKIRHSCDPDLTDNLPDWYKQDLFVTQDGKRD